MEKSVNIDSNKLLRGVYETERIPGGIPYPRTEPDFTRNILNEHGVLYRPVVDEDHLEKGGQKPVWPDGKAFCVCLTHDADWVSQYSLRQSIRKAGRDNVSGRRKDRIITDLTKDIVRNLLRFGKKDDFNRYEEWLKVEERIGARSTFFFWPGRKSVKKPHRTDCLYEMTDDVVFDGRKCTVSDMIKEIDQRGREIGLHASWNSSDDADEMKRQKESLERVVGHEVASVRQHFLHYDIRVTPGVQAEAGFKYDSTLGFNDNIGFRFGTCYPWNLYNIDTGKETDLLEVPLIIQDGAMLSADKFLKLNTDEAFARISELGAEVEKAGGVLTLLWHPHVHVWPEWKELYIKTLDHFKNKNAWFAPVKETGEWWQKNKPEIRRKSGAQ